MLLVFFLRTETKKSLKRSLWSNFNLNLKRSFCSFPELCSFIRKIASIFLDTYSLNIGLLPVLGVGLFQMHSISNNNIVFLAEAEFEVNIFIFLLSLGWKYSCEYS